MYAFFVKKYNGKRFRQWGEFSKLKDAQIEYEFLKKHSGYSNRGSQVQLRVYDVNSQKWKWLGDWNDL